MSTKPTTDNQNKRKRRPRNAAGERNFICGCNKSYLSYPALYTHVKNKHNGIFPVGSNAKKKIEKLSDQDLENFKPNLQSFFANFEKYLKELNDAHNEKKQEEFNIQTIFDDRIAQFFGEKIKNY